MKDWKTYVIIILVLLLIYVVYRYGCLLMAIKGNNNSNFNNLSQQAKEDINK